MKKRKIVVIFIYQIVSLLTIISISCYIIHNKVTNKLSSDIEESHSSSPKFDLYDRYKEDQKCYRIFFGFKEYTVQGEQIGCTGRYGCETKIYSYHTYIKYFYIWKHTIFYYPEPYFNYTKLLNNYSVPRGEKCREGYKQCGILDSVGNILCLEEEQKCPINDMIMVKNGEFPESFMKYKNVTKLPIGDEDVLYYTNEAIDKEIIVSLEVKKKNQRINFILFWIQYQNMILLFKME